MVAFELTQRIVDGVATEEATLDIVLLLAGVNEGGAEIGAVGISGDPRNKDELCTIARIIGSDLIPARAASYCVSGHLGNG